MNCVVRLYWAALSNILSGGVKWFKRLAHNQEIVRFESSPPHPITNIGVIMNNKSTFLNNCYEWLFSEQERTPVGYIIVFLMIIIMSLIISLFVVAVDRHIDGWVNYIWN